MKDNDDDRGADDAKEPTGEEFADGQAGGGP